YDIDGQERVYDIEAMEDGTQLKAYIVDGAFICKEDENGSYSISDFQILNNDTSSNNFTNYFLLDDINYGKFSVWPIFFSKVYIIKEKN
ncbi:MAG: hypothetical protein J6T10_22335, partial [Methanobrevibacter sp.]|nr:hypothetical protein [Methanobrevibacter sp.]